MQVPQINNLALRRRNPNSTLGCFRESFIDAIPTLAAKSHDPTKSMVCGDVELQPCRVWKAPQEAPIFSRSPGHGSAPAAIPMPKRSLCLLLRASCSSIVMCCGVEKENISIDNSKRFHY
jgi:hypothetical protein